MVVGEYQAVVRSYQDLPSAGLAEHQLVDPACVVGLDAVGVVALLLAAGEIELQDLARGAVLLFLEPALDLALGEVEADEDAFLLSLALLVTVDDPQQVQKLSALDVELDLLVLGRRTPAQPLVVQDDRGVVQWLEDLASVLIVLVDEVQTPERLVRRQNLLLAQTQRHVP